MKSKALLAALCVAGTIITGMTAEAATKFVNIGTGGTAGTYYPLGGAMADILNKNVPECNASAQSTGASVANVNLLIQGKVDVAFIQNDIAYYAATGKEMFTGKKVEGLRGLCTIYPEVVQVFTVKGTGIKTIADFKGKAIAVGAAGSGTEANARQIMAAHGVTYKDCKVRYLSFAEASSALKDGNIDAAFITAGYPTAAVQDLATTKEIEMIPVSDGVAAKLMKQYPFYTKVVIPAGTYNKQTAAIPAMSVKCMLATTNKVDEKLVYDMTKALYGNLDRMKAAHSAASAISLATAQEGMSIPMAPGAAKFFKK